MSLSADERETTVNVTDGDELVRIWTAQRTHITKMRKDSAFTEVESGIFEGTEFARFTIPAERWSPIGVKRTRNMSAEARAAASERMAQTRASRSKEQLRKHADSAPGAEDVQTDVHGIEASGMASVDSAGVGA